MISCSVSRSLPLTRTKSPWIAACTFFFEFLIDLDDLARLLDRDALLHGDALAHGRARRRFDGAVLQRLQRHVALHQLALQHVVDGLQLELVGRGQDQGLFAFQLDVGLRVLQIVARVDFLQRLLNGVGDFLQVHLADNVKCVLSHILQCSKTSAWRRNRVARCAVPLTLDSASRRKAQRMSSCACRLR